MKPYYEELSISQKEIKEGPARMPFNESFCKLLEDLKPKVVSFHFGLPQPELLSSVKSSGAFVMSSATTVAEARRLEAQGVDAVIAQGLEVLENGLGDDPTTWPTTARRKSV